MWCGGFHLWRLVNLKSEISAQNSFLVVAVTPFGIYVDLETFQRFITHVDTTIKIRIVDFDTNAIWIQLAIVFAH